MFLEKLVSFVSVGYFRFISFCDVLNVQQRHPVDGGGITPGLRHVAAPTAEAFLRQHVCAERPYVRVCMLAPWRN